MPFSILFSLLQPLLIAALRVLLPWIIERVTADIKAGRPTVILDSEVGFVLQSRKDAVRAAYRGN